MSKDDDDGCGVCGDDDDDRCSGNDVHFIEHLKIFLNFVIFS